MIIFCFIVSYTLGMLLLLYCVASCVVAVLCIIILVSLICTTVGSYLVTDCYCTLCYSCIEHACTDEEHAVFL